MTEEKEERPPQSEFIRTRPSLHKHICDRMRRKEKLEKRRRRSSRWPRGEQRR